MYHKTLIKDDFGQHYSIQTFIDPKIRGNLSPKEFSDQHLAQQFVQRLQVPTGYWQGLMQDIGSVSPMMNESDMICAVCERIVTGRLKVFPVNPPSPTSDSPKKRTIQTTDKVYHFVPSVEQLLNKTDTKNFKSVDEAKSFLQKLKPDTEQLKGMASELSISVPATASANPAELSNAIAESMAAGDTVVMVDNIASATQPTNVEAAAAAVVQQAGLGPEEENKTQEKKEEKPCTLHKYTVECSHGRSVTLDPTKQKEAVVPRLELVSVSSNADKDKQEKITVNLKLDDPCDSHAKEQVKINSDLASYVGDTYGTSVEIRTPSKPLDVKEQHFRYVWLPSVKPVKYKVNPSMGFCHTEKFDGKGKGVPIYVYPDMKWEWKTTINFGKLEFVPGKSEVKYSDFKIGDDSNVVLTYDGERIDAKEKYKEYITKPMEGFKKVCDTVGKVLEAINDPKAVLMRIGSNAMKPKPKKGDDNKDGNESKLLIDWPNLTLDFTSQLIENDKPQFVDHDYSLKIKAKPLLDIDIQIDVLESMISAAPYPVAELMRYAKKRIEEEFSEEQKVGLRGELDIIFTVKSTININESELKGRHNVAEHDKSVEPIKGDIKIPAKLKGAVKAEGKWFVISFTVHYKMKGETEWSGDFEFGHDDKGIYFSNTVEFKGIDVTLTKYEEIKAELETEAGNKEVSVDDFYASVGAEAESSNAEASVEMKDGKLEGNATVKAEEEKRWSWLKPKEDEEKIEPKKYYIVER